MADLSTPSGAYRDARERLTELLGPLDDSDGSASVRSTPGWTVTDVAAHLAGLVADWLDGRAEGYGSAPWTEVQVLARRDRSIAEILEEWTAKAPRFEATMDDPTAHGLPDFMPYLAVADLAIHEGDIRGALGRPGGRDSAAVELGMKTYVTGVRQRHAETDLGPLLVVEDGGREWSVGRGEPRAAVTAARYELFRAMAGRRSREQVRRMSWSGDADAYVDLFLGPGFAWAEEDSDH